MAVELFVVSAIIGFYIHFESCDSRGRCFRISYMPANLVCHARRVLVFFMSVTIVVIYARTFLAFPVRTLKPMLPMPVKQWFCMSVDVMVSISRTEQQRFREARLLPCSI